MKLLQLLFVFIKIGAISFGGGYAMIPFLQYEVVSRGWLTEQEIIDMVGMSQITPGPIATNMATFVGYSEAGVLGAIVATIGVTLPPMIMVILVTKYIIKKLPDNIRVTIFMGLQPVVIGLIFCSVISLADSVILINGGSSFQVDIAPLLITIVSFILLVKYKLSPIKLIILSAFVGALIL